MSISQLSWVSAISHKTIPQHLGSKLRDVYSELIFEPIPDHFADLLKQLDVADDASAKGPDTPQPTE